MVISGVSGLVVGLHVGRIRDAATCARSGPILVDVMRHALCVVAPILSQSERIATGDIQFVARIGASIVGESRFAGIVPFEHAVRGDAPRKDIGKFGHFEVTGVGDEAPAISFSPGQGGEGDHIATFQFETLYTVIQFGRREGVHVSARVLQSEIIDRLTPEILL